MKSFSQKLRGRSFMKAKGIAGEIGALIPPLQGDQKRSILDLSTDQKRRAQKLHEQAIIINMKEPTAVREGQFMAPYVRLLLEKGLSGLGVGAGGLSINEFLKGPQSYDAFLNLVDQNPILLSLATKATHFQEAKAAKKLSIFLTTSRLAETVNDLANIRTMYRLGVRQFQLTYQYMNAIGCGCGDRIDAGLSKFGVKVVEEMNRLGMLIDVAHCAPKTFSDAVQISQHPVIYSHGGARALRDHIRLLRDEQIEALAKKGGIICISACSHFLKKGGATKGATVDTYLDHIDHVVKLIGVEHVGVGLDIIHNDDLHHFEQSFAESNKRYPEIYENPEPYVLEKVAWIDGLGMFPVGQGHNYSYITQGLVARGYSDGDIIKILGQNVLRLFKMVCG